MDMNLDMVFGGGTQGGRSQETINGVMLGVVTNNKDPDKLGRVKLKLPIRETEFETDWVRTTTLMGGKERGSLFVPEVGDEVLVAFLLGDPNKPYVIGSLWSKTAAPPAGNDKNDLRRIVSRKGHVIEFDDAEGGGKIEITSKKGHKLVIDDQNNKIELMDKPGQNGITIMTQGSTSVKIKSSTSEVVIDSKGDIKISSTKQIELKAPQLNLEAQAQMSIKAGAALDIKCDGMVNIKGAMVKIN